MLAYIWTGLVLAALVFGLLNGSAGEVSAAALEGAGQAVTLCLELCGAICLWSGVMKVMEKAGLASRLGRLLRPLLVRLYPTAAADSLALDALAENMSANLLGLGNAATPAGIRAAERLKTGPVAGDALCRLVVMNTASIQLIPATVCAARAAAGSRTPFDILPAVWLSSLVSVAAGLTAAFLFSKAARR